MLKKIVLLFVMLALPSLASAWTIAARVATGTGAIFDGSTAITPSPGFISLPSTATSKTLRVTPAGLARISQVVVDGRIATGTAAEDGISRDYTISYGGINSHSITASFAIPRETVTSIQVPNGTFTVQQTYPTIGTPTTGTLSLPMGAKIKVVATPNSSYRTSRITVGATDFTPPAPLDPGVSFTASDITIAGDTSVTASYQLVPTVNPSLSVSPSSGFPGTVFTFDATGTTTNDSALQYAFTVYDQSNSVVHSRPSGSAISDTYAPAAVGTYSVVMSATTPNGGAATRTASFQVLDRVAYEVQQCTGCHQNGTPTAVAQYYASPHAGKRSCQDCHTAAPHQAPPSGDICTGCHAPHIAGSTNPCLECHNAHNPLQVTIGYPHTSDFTTAQYVTPNITCANCHASTQDSDFHIFPANREWAQGGKANPRSASWMAYDFKTRGTPGPATAATTASDDCVRCHTTTGYINYLTSGYTSIDAWGSADDRTREMIACNACHNTPFDADFSTRGFVPNPLDPSTPLAWGPAPPSGYFNYSSAVTGKLLVRKDPPLPAGKSNICVACHTGKAAGETIKAISLTAAGKTGSFWQGVDFVNPHYMGAAGILYRWTGYTYRTTLGAYSNPPSFVHYTLGDNEAGNCVICHMSSSDKHLFSVVSKDQNGAITAITSARCNDCHLGGSHSIPDGAALEVFRKGYEASLQVVAQLLADKGIHFNSSVYPYFFTTVDPAQQSFATRTRNWDAHAPTFPGSDIMGAAFNLKLLQADAGAWAHNSFYTKRLLYDTVDFLDDGDATNNSVSATIADLTVSATITPDVKTRALGYIGTRP